MTSRFLGIFVAFSFVAGCRSPAREAPTTIGPARLVDAADADATDADATDADATDADATDADAADASGEPPYDPCDPRSASPSPTAESAERLAKHPPPSFLYKAKEVVTAVDPFAFELFAQTSGRNSLVLSPMAVGSTLLMLAASAEGTPSESEVLHVLHLEAIRRTAIDDGVRLVYGFFAADGDDGDLLGMAHRLWVQRDAVRVTDTRTARNADHVPGTLNRLFLPSGFNTSIGVVDYCGGGAAARASIDAWARVQTHNRLGSGLTARDVTGATRFLAWTGAYFTGGQRTAAPRDASAERPLRAYEDALVRVFEVPVRGTVSMLFAVPRRGVDLSAVEARLPTEAGRWRAALAPLSGSLRVEPFNVDTTITLNGALGALTLESPFRSTSDFAYLFGAPGVRLDAIVHRVAFRCSGWALSGRGQPTFDVKPPFVFLVVEAISGAVLFIGRDVR